MKRIGWLVVGVAMTSSIACSTVFGDFYIVGIGGGGMGGTGGGAVTTTTTSSLTCTGDASACASKCVDLQADPHNCGRCGHDCLYGQCMAGVCQPWIVATNTTVAAKSMDADAAYVVWSDLSQQVHLVKAGGGEVTTLSTPVAGIGPGPVVRSGNVVFLGSDHIYGLSEDQPSATAQSALVGNYSPAYLALSPDGATAFLLGADSGSPYSTVLLQCPLMPQGFCQPIGGPVDPGMAGSYSAFDLRVNVTYAFWIYSGKSVHRYTFGSGAVQAIDFSSGGSNHFALDASNVYWIAAPASTVYSLPQSFMVGAMPVTLMSVPTQVAGLAADGTNVYVGTYDPSGSATLSYVPVHGGTATTIYTSPNNTAAGAVGPVVAAGGAVYWSDANYAVSPAKTTILGIAAP